MNLNQYFDHTTLKPDASQQDIDQVIREVSDNHFSSVVVTPKWVSYVSQQLLLSTVKTNCITGMQWGENSPIEKLVESNVAIGVERLGTSASMAIIGKPSLGSVKRPFNFN